ncbi:hypothetical protein [Aestuariivirga sp.]|jgi:hypothetical protein|uniref:hypothetical protein n=1 Tax=Aestuariivirga sp. TaxID=2650926 RepID=UPI00378378A8
MTAALVKNRERLAFMRRESLRVGGWSPEFRSYLRRHHIDLETCNAHCGYFNVALVKFWTGNDGDRSFTFDPDGQPAAIIEALLFDDDKEPFTADLVAWPLNAPGEFVTAMGLNDGADVLGPVNMVRRAGVPLVLHRTPLAWLQAGCQGCVPLKPGARHWLAKAGGPFVVEDVDHGLELRDLLEDRDRRHEILVPSQRAEVAA